MPEKPKFGIVTICDAAYRDLFTGKAVIAGHYSGDILVTQFPWVVPAAFYIELLNPHAVDRHLDFEIAINGVQKGHGTLEIDNASPDPAVMIMAASPLAVDAPGEIQLRVKSGSGKPIVALRKAIRLQPPPST